MALQIIFGMPDQKDGIQQALRIFWENFTLEDEILGEYPDEFSGAPSPRSCRFAEDLACGVAENLPEIDKRIKEFSTNWTLERMARVDLSLLRLAVFEILFCSEVPVNVVIKMRPLRLAKGLVPRRPRLLSTEFSTKSPANAGNLPKKPLASLDSHLALSVGGRGTDQVTVGIVNNQKSSLKELAETIIPLTG